jgi:hypothetical protein
MKMPFKYAEQIKELRLTNCPPAFWRPVDCEAFRYVFEDIEHPQNFTPPLVIRPRRINSSGFHNDYVKCCGFALSFFDTLQNAQAHYARLRKNNPHIGKTIGTHIATGAIEKTDGVASDAHQKTGHFDVHEYEHSSLQSKFSILIKMS